MMLWWMRPYHILRSKSYENSNEQNWKRVWMATKNSSKGKCGRFGIAVKYIKIVPIAI